MVGCAVLLLLVTPLLRRRWRAVAIAVAILIPLVGRVRPGRAGRALPFRRGRRRAARAGLGRRSPRPRSEAWRRDVGLPPSPPTEAEPELREDVPEPRTRGRGAGDELGRHRRRHRRDGQRRGAGAGPPRPARARPGPVRPGARARLQPRRVADLPAVLPGGPGVRAAAAAGLGPLAPAGRGQRHGPVRADRRAVRRAAGRADLRRLAALGASSGTCRTRCSTPPAVARRFPTFRLAPGELALFEQRAGYARPEATVAAQLRLAAAAGAELRFDEPVESWQAGPPARVRTAAGTYEADALVLTPGAWAPELAGLGPADGGRAAGHALGRAGRPDRPVRAEPGLHLRRRAGPGLRLPGHRRAGRRGEGVVLPGRRADHAGDRRPGRAAGRGGRAAAGGRPAGASPG